MASLNSSQARVLASATAQAAPCLASWYTLAASGVPQANHRQQECFVRFKQPKILITYSNMFLQLDGTPYGLCPQTGSGIATVTGTADLMVTATGGSIDNGGGEHSPLRLYVCDLPLNLVKAFLEVGVEFILDQGLLTGNSSFMGNNCKPQSLVGFNRLPTPHGEG
ncbi:hypothetical protein XENORESO_016325 [Xenotaenia resolanae]|uniref:Uncharacterized protein n=1 Tax=Xenotaenia resolanae TaxID=208358 RepID=A0ABV0VUS7_9TELE